MKQETVAGVIVFRMDMTPRFLILQSKKWGTWGFPKGHVEQGETEEQTALRELREESGIVGQLSKGFVERYEYTFEFEGKKILKRAVFFLAQTSEKKVTLSANEHSSFRWATYEDALSLLTHEDTKRMLIKAHEYLSNEHRV